MITYSFIIPHHNSPDLLDRLLDSIPHRDDIQIIVVDDNSSADKRPNVDRSDVEIYNIDAAHTKGAGHARNVGLEHAKGKWLLFADADDYYMPGFLEILDEYSGGDIDVLYYSYERAIDGERNFLSDKKGIQKIVDEYDGSEESIARLKFCNHAPWSKMVRREYVAAGGFCFECVPNGNDTMFSYYVGYNTNKILVIRDAIYVYTLTAGSITQKKKNRRAHLSRLNNITKNNCYYQMIGHDEWRTPAFKYILHIMKHNSFTEGLCVLYWYIVNYYSIYSQRNTYVNKVIRKI